MEKITVKEKQRFSIIARFKSLTHAWRGIRILFRTTHNSWSQIASAVLVVVAGFIFSISNTEWLFVILCIFMVIITEAINTAIEIDIDLTSPNFHPYARDTKDVAAASVMLSVISSLIIGSIIFIPKIAELIF